MAKAKKPTGTNPLKIIGVGVGIAALSLTSYLLLGEHGKKNRKAVKAWAFKMKAEVAEKLEHMQEVTQPVYEKVVHEVADKYKKLKNIDVEEVETELDHLKKEWHKLTKSIKSPVSKKKVAKKKVSKK
jgi:gas vesicle protein